MTSDRIKLLSFNIQTGIITQSYAGQILGSWRHIVPYRGRSENLAKIAHFLRDYDLVGLQEVDAGSLRTGFVNQVKFLAEMAGFSHWHHQRNRNFGRFAQHSNGLLSKLKPISVHDYKLPGIIPGRGAILALFGDINNPLAVVILHLSLGAKTRHTQLDFVATMIRQYQHIVIMGDLNCPLDYILNESPLKSHQLHEVAIKHHTFPSWKPVRDIDHILVSSSIDVHELKVVDKIFSDHLPISIELTLPKK